MDSITPGRTQISDRFPVASFTVSLPERRWIEIACATDPRLFHRDHQPLRTPRNFFSSRVRGLIPSAGLNTTWLLPSEQLQQFAGAPRLYYALATYGGPRGEDARFSVHPAALERTPSISLSADFTGRTLDRTRVGAPAPDARYGATPERALSWGGDDALAALAPQAARVGSAGHAAYDDGYGSALWDSKPLETAPGEAAPPAPAEELECWDDQDAQASSGPTGDAYPAAPPTDPNAYGYSRALDEPRLGDDAEELEDGPALARAGLDGDAVGDDFADGPRLQSRPRAAGRRFGEGVRKRALVVGINAYQNITTLNGCENDANSMKGVLKQYYGFADGDIKTLLSAQATRAGMLAELRRLFSECGAGDVIVFFYSGHGASLIDPTNPNRLVQGLCPVETPGHPATSDLITDADLTALLSSAAEGANITIIFDSCFSGGMGEAVGVPDITIKGLPLPAALTEGQSVTVVPVGVCQIVSAGYEQFYVCGSGRVSNARLVCERRPNTTVVPYAKATLFTAVDYSELALDPAPGESNGLYTAALVDVISSGQTYLTNEQVQQRVVEAVAAQPRGNNTNPMLRGQASRMRHNFLTPYTSSESGMAEAAARRGQGEAAWRPGRGAEDGPEVAALALPVQVIYEPMGAPAAARSYGDPTRRAEAPPRERARVVLPPPLELDLQQKLRIAGAVARAGATAQGYGAVEPSPLGELGDDEGVALGLFGFTQRSGALGKVLRALRQRDPAGFESAFGPDGDEVLRVAAARSPEERLEPVSGRHLWEEPWLSSLRSAGALTAMCPAQNEVAVTEYLDPQLDAAAWLGLDTPRALALLHERCLRLGNSAGLGWVARAAGPLRTNADRDAALRALGHPDLRSFQREAGLPATGAFDGRTQAALAGAMRQLGPRSPFPLHGTAQMLDRVVEASRGSAAHARLLRLRKTNELSDASLRAA